MMKTVFLLFDEGCTIHPAHYYLQKPPVILLGGWDKEDNFNLYDSLHETDKLVEVGQRGECWCDDWQGHHEKHKITVIAEIDECYAPYILKLIENNKGGRND